MGIRSGCGALEEQEFGESGGRAEGGDKEGGLGEEIGGGVIVVVEEEKRGRGVVEEGGEGVAGPWGVGRGEGSRTAGLAAESGQRTGEAG